MSADSNRGGDGRIAGTDEDARTIAERTGVIDTGRSLAEDAPTAIDERRSGRQPAVVADAVALAAESFPSADYSEIATRVVGQRSRAVSVERTEPVIDPTSGRHRAVPEMPVLQRVGASRRTLSGKEVVDGRYEIKTSIARGSMSRVYLAEQVSIGRQVALKIINSDFSDEHEQVERFRREARVLSRIDHPNVVTLYDIGETATGDPYIAMEFVKGASLEAMIESNGRLGPEHTAGLLLQIARGLAVVHEVGVIHRDLKPSNILVVNTLRGGVRAKIADFGLAKVVRDHIPGDELTRAGSVLGTPEYMSPEQVKGIPVDRRADIYALGCVAYEMLTGEPPFAGEDIGTLHKHLHETPRPMKEACPEARIPAAFEAVVRKAMSKTPEDRYATAPEFYAGLLRASDETGIPRSDLRLLEALIDDPAYAELDLGVIAFEKQEPKAAPPAPAPPVPRRSGFGVLTVVAAMTVALAGGVAIERFVASGESGPKASLPPQPATAASGLVVAAHPSGARCGVADAELGPMPAVFNGLGAGRHAVRCELPGYINQTVEVELKAGEQQVVEIELKRPVYEARIETEPAGATLKIDGADAGQSPMTIELTEGEFHDIGISLEGYRTRNLLVPADEKTEELRVVLKPALAVSATLFVDSPSRARIYIDDEDTGEWTPSGEIVLEPGRHEVSVLDGVGTRRSQRIKLKADAVARIRF